jgi:Legionella pneumophila major outer membrane protein precursor
MKWRVGVRLNSLFFESTDTSPLLQERVANSFFGAGPHLALDLYRPIVPHHVGLFCKLDASGVLGQVRQSFEETQVTPAGPLSGYTSLTQFVPTVSLMVQAGVAWTPVEHCRLSVGYSYEHWWDVGFAGAINQPASFSRADLTFQGIFFRGEWKY